VNISGAVVRRLLTDSDALVFNLDKCGYASDLTSIEALPQAAELHAHRFCSSASHREREAQAACGPGLRWGNSHRGATSVTSPGAAISPQPPGAPLAHASAERPWKSSYSATMDLLQRISIDPAVR